MQIKIIAGKKVFKSNKSEYTALKNATLEVESGEFLSIMGPSGSGKTTLLNVISGIDRLSSGIYEYDGKDVSNMSSDEGAVFRNKNIGYVNQNYCLLENYTAIDNVAMALLYKNTLVKRSERIKYKEILKKSLEALKSVKIDKLKDKKINELSGGEKQRVAIARALVNDSRLILADEPTAALDRTTGNDLMELFKEINKKGTTIIIVTHDIEVGRATNRIITIEDGVCGF
ncbi:MAG: ABC transporter ATP-binding protein [Clostridium sp.]